MVDFRYLSGRGWRAPGASSTIGESVWSQRFLGWLRLSSVRWMNWVGNCLLRAEAVKYGKCVVMLE